MKLEGRIAAVTGGSAGIGRGIAEAYLAEGASVAVMARKAEKAEKMLAEIGAGDRLIFIQGDAMDQASVEGFVDQPPLTLVGLISSLTTQAAQATCSQPSAYPMNRLMSA